MHYDKEAAADTYACIYVMRVYVGIYGMHEYERPRIG